MRNSVKIILAILMLLCYTITTMPAQATNYTNELSLLSRTIWGEARGESIRGMEAIASVIMNRVADRRWGHSVVMVIKKSKQFSVWNENDVNFRKMLRVTVEDMEYAAAKRIARRALKGVLPDPTGGATHYHAKGDMPYWAIDAKPTIEIGNHIFYKDVP